MRHYNVPVVPVVPDDYQELVDDGRGYIASITISHAETDAQNVIFRTAATHIEIARYIVTPTQSPASIFFPKDRPVWFERGLEIKTGLAYTNLVLVY